MEKVQIIVTGATGGMGSEAVRALAKQGHSVIMACRNLEKGETIRKRILDEIPSADLTLMQVDLTSLKSVVEFTETIKKQNIKLKGLFNNAGAINRHFALTEDGFEQTVAVNYVAPYLLTRRLLPAFTENANLVNMVSLTRFIAKLERDFFEKGEKDFRQLSAYSDSKLALLLFTIALSQRVGFHVNMADPGVVNTGILRMNRWFDPLADVFFRPFCKSPEKGVMPAVNALNTSYNLHFFNGNKNHEVPEKYLSNPNIEWLWETTEQILQEKGFSCC